MTFEQTHDATQLLTEYWEKYGDSSEYDDIYDAFYIGQRALAAENRALQKALGISRGIRHPGRPAPPRYD